MLHLSIIDKPREGAEAFSSGDILRYTQSLFGMYGGKTQKVTLEGRNDLVGVVIDRFGKDIQITESILAPFIQKGLYRNKYMFSTCRKFKGLEADAIILIDVDREVFSADNVLLFYVGTSRARLKLDIITALSDEECREILINELHYNGRIRKPKKDLAGALNAVGSLSE